MRCMRDLVKCSKDSEKAGQRQDTFHTRLQPWRLCSEAMPRQDIQAGERRLSYPSAYDRKGR